MAKRSTIGENPLDLLVAENALDTVVPGPAAAARGAKLEERLDRLEAGMAEVQVAVKPLGPEVDRNKGETSQVKAEMAGIKAELARLQAALPQLQAEVAELKAEVTQLRAKMVPSDIPWWMGGKRK
jgi:seryl-tRNA synthetase